VNSHFGGITLVGYYGYDNLGDDLLLLSSLSLIEEAGYRGKVYIPAKPGISRPLESVSFKMQVEVIPRFSFAGIMSALKRSSLVIFGGGNLFQDETSSRSFRYYHCIAKRSLKSGSKLLLLSQGFGHIRKRSNYERLKSILGHPQTYSLLRDRVSARYNSFFSKNAYSGTDYGPYVLFRQQLIPPCERKKSGIAVVVLKNGTPASRVISILEEKGIRSIAAIGFHNNHDNMKKEELEAFARKRGLEVLSPQRDWRSLVSLFSDAEIVISERLHGVILALTLGVPFVWRSSKKNDRFVQSIDPSLKLSYDKTGSGLEENVALAMESDICPLRDRYVEELEMTASNCKELISSLLARE